MDMEMSRSTKVNRQSGFSLLEVIVAVFVLAFGLLAVAGLMTQASVGTNNSRSSGLEVILASEKLEDLNQLGVKSLDPRLTPGGHLNNDDIGYSDSVQISSGLDASTAGDIVETTIVTTGASPTYTQISHSPNGTASYVTNAGTPPAPTPDMLVFDRRWMIEQDAPVAGVLRITVWVRLQPAYGAAGLPFQTSSVRPYK
jgi:prepilin-type N-terminal cleavage/methylation domain-containing protein